MNISRGRTLVLVAFLLTAVAAAPATGAADDTTDSDGDGLSDEAERETYDTNPNKSDTDGDGLHDGKEVNTYGTDPGDPDTDGDSLTDGEEVDKYQTSPLKKDSDGDGVPDDIKVQQTRIADRDRGGQATPGGEDEDCTRQRAGTTMATEGGCRTDGSETGTVDAIM